jgi:tetratricopeptide (TPR) repeat protein
MERTFFFALVLLGPIVNPDSCPAQDNKISRQAQNILGAAQKLYDDGHYQESADTVENAVMLFEKINDTTGLIRSLNLQGENMANLNLCDKAIEILNRSMQIATTRLPDDHPELAQSHYFLSRAYGGCARKFDDAIPLMQKSIRMKRKIHGEGVEVAFDYTFMGYMLYSKGQFDSALVYLNKALWIREKGLTPGDVETSNTLYHLGRLYEQRSELALALEFHLKSFRIRNKKLNAEHASISNSVHQIGSVYQKMGNFDRALEYYQQALETRRKSLGEDHANVASSYFTIGNLYGSMFNYHQAIHYIKQGNAILEKKYGEKSDILPTYEAYLGRMYGYIGDQKNATASLEKALVMAQQNLKDDHPYLAIVYNILGD